MCVELAGGKPDKAEYQKLLFEIYRDVLNNDILANPATGTVDLHRFRNIFNTALDISETEWAEQFLKKYLRTLQKEHVSNMEHFFYGKIEYVKGNYEKTLEYFSKLDQTQFIFMKDLKYEYLKCYYALGHTESAISLVDSFRHFVSNNDAVPEFQRVEVLDFLKKYMSLVNLRTKYSKNKYEELERLLKDSKDSWFYKRLKEIKAS
jgi:tetratricopeptide (TPR) repeat protein